MAEPLSQTEQALARGALWSVATSSNRIDVAQLPAALRPCRVEEAVEVINDLDDPGASARRRATVWMAAGGAIDAGGQRRTGVRTMALDSAILIPSFIQILAPILGMTAALRDLVEKVFSEHDGLCSIPEGLAAAPAKYNGITKQTEIRAYYLTTRPLEDLRVLLDPRNWSRCGDLFRETRRVAGPVRRPYQPLTPDPDELGDPWRGYLFESTDMGTAANDVVLAVHHRPIHRKDSTMRTPVLAAVETDFHLVDSLETSLGPYSFTGLLQEDSGSLRAERLPQGHRVSPKFKTRIRCIKTVRTGRVSAWSGAAGWDFGELLNYLSPAVLTLWTTHLQTIVPCCARSF